MLKLLLFRSVIDMWQQGKHPNEELISALADGRLGVGETRRVATHLHDCESCRNLLSDFERTKILLRSMEAPVQPEQKFWDDTFRKMRTADSQSAALGTQHADTIRTRRQLQGAFALAACLLGVVFVGPLTNRVQSPSTTGASPTTAASDDTIDNADVSTFVRAHTESVAYQPLSDPDRQQMIAAEAEGSPAGDQVTEAVATSDVSP